MDDLTLRWGFFTANQLFVTLALGRVLDLKFSFADWDTLGQNLMFASGIWLYGGMTLLLPLREVSAFAAWVYVQTAGFSVFWQLMCSKMVFMLMVTGNLIGEDTTMNDWIGALVYLGLGVYAGLVQDKWYVPLR